MRRRLFCPLLAAAVLATVLGGAAPSARAAIRIIIGDGINSANDKVFYSELGGALTNTFASFNTDFDGFELVATTTTSNFSGTSAEGFLSQFVTVTDTNGVGTLSQLQVSTAIVANQAGFSTGLVTGAQATFLAAQPSLLFTLPSDTNLSVTSRVNTLGATDTNATVQLATVVNGGTTTSMTTVDGSFNQTMGTATGLPGYTLASSITLTGATPGVSGLQLIGRSSVSPAAALVPEPATTLVWGLGAVGLVFAASRRRVKPTVA